MSDLIRKQCELMLASLNAFENSCRMAALSDDGVVDENEARQLAQIGKCTREYKNELLRMMQN